MKNYSSSSSSSQESFDDFSIDGFDTPKKPKKPSVSKARAKHSMPRVVDYPEDEDVLMSNGEEEGNHDEKSGSLLNMNVVIQLFKDQQQQEEDGCVVKKSGMRLRSRTNRDKS
jgi:hypothetical protein